jgi:periplasmic divalent cation tolerance protein
MHLIYITFSTKDEAIKIANNLIRIKLIACANIYSGVISIYEWKGEIMQNEEVTLICKTSDILVDEVVSFVKSTHTHECPCIIAIKVTKGNEDFLKWVETCTKVPY